MEIDEVIKNKLRFFLSIKTGLLTESANDYASFYTAIFYQSSLRNCSLSTAKGPLTKGQIIYNA